MAINQLKYAQEFEKQQAAGKGFAEADATATKAATIKRPKKPIGPKKKSLLKRAKKGIQMAYHGKEYHKKVVSRKK